MLLRAACWCVLLLAAGSAHAQSVLSLEQALSHARAHAPELAQAKTSVAAAEARADIARSPLLPQLSGSMGYTRSTFNSSVETAAAAARSRDSLDTRGQWSAGLRVSQLVYDFGQTRNGLRAAQASARAQVENARGTARDVEYGVRGAFLDAAAARALVQVAQETLDNQLRHQAQIQGFVEVGTRPQIDLAQARTDVANARLGLVRAQNTYAVAKRQLERAMGFAPAGDYDVSDELPQPEADEAAGIERLLQIAEQTRPEFAALSQQLRAQEFSVSAAQAGSAPAIDVVGNMEESGPDVDALAFNAGVGVSLSWPIFSGGVTGARVREARAELAGLQVQREILRKDTRLALEQAVLSLRAAEESVAIAQEVVVNARERLRLAEGRYAAGVGNIIELGDAQLVLSEAESQRVGATYDVGQARLQLRRGLGR
ncbi:MAG TPA: TolC family protein [Polyangiales bacterium]|nr:TolC family protein [Polyangiales bacterium]